LAFQASPSRHAGKRREGSRGYGSSVNSGFVSFGGFGWGMAGVVGVIDFGGFELEAPLP
jgi:hypothetical protein